MNQNSVKKSKEPKNNTSKFSFKELWNGRQTRSILIASGAILLCLVVYVVLMFTVLRDEEEIPLPTVGNHGEAMQNGRPFVIGPFEESQLRGISVNNDKGGFNYYMGEDGVFYFEDAEAMLYNITSAWMDSNYNEEELGDMVDTISITDSLVFISRYMLAIEEVVDYNKDNLAVYGLDGEGKASMTVTYVDKDGTEKSQTVYFGNKTASGASYYVRIKGRDAVYIISDSAITRCIFADLRDYLSPQLAPVVSSTLYTEVDRYTIKKHGETFIDIQKLSDEQIKQNAELFTHELITPSGYFPSAENFPLALEPLMTISGSQVLEWGFTDKLSDPAKKDEITDMFRLYNLIDKDGNWVYEFYYYYSNPGFNTTLYFSEKLEVQNEVEGEETEYIYYVYSPGFDLIAEIKAEEHPWLEWGLLNYMDEHSFTYTIDGVASMEFSYGATKAKFDLTGEGTELKVSCSTGIPVDTENFRQLFKAVLYTTIDGYAQKPDNSSEILSVKITLRDGKQFDYRYYGITARKAFYTLNGEGEFYVNRDYVKQMMSACDGILAGKQVTVEHKN